MDNDTTPQVDAEVVEEQPIFAKKEKPVEQEDYL